MIQIRGHIRKDLTIENEMPVSEMLRSLNLDEDEYVVIVNGKPVLGDHVIRPDDSVTVLEVFSGG